MTKERPIIFSGEMVRAILDGRKTATRRVIKPQPPFEDAALSTVMDTTGDRRSVGKHQWVHAKNWDKVSDGYFSCPCGRPGDLLYVRETFGVTPGIDEHLKEDGLTLGDLELDDVMHVGYRADGSGAYAVERWRPSIHMPKWAARIWLRVTAVRVERVQDIDNHDSWREGVPDYYVSWDGKRNHAWDSVTPRNPDGYQDDGSYMPEARDVFADMWDSINAKRGYSWDSNPFVWVVEFEVVD